MKTEGETRALGWFGGLLGWSDASRCQAICVPFRRNMKGTGRESIRVLDRVCVALFYQTDIGGSLQSRGHSLRQGHGYGNGKGTLNLPMQKICWHH